MSATPLLLLGLFGVYCTFYLVEANGTNALIHDFIAAAKLPNSDVSLRTAYTGLNPLDRILTYIVALLWPVTDLQNTLLTLHATTFLAGTNAIWTLLLLEGYRRGNLKTVAGFPIIFTLLGQLAFPVGISLYCALHLATSITVHSPTRKNLTVPRLVLRIILVTTALGLIIPVTILHAPVSHDTKQIFIAARQFWPIYSSMSIFFAHAILSTPKNTPAFQTDADTELDTNTDTHTDTDKCTLRLIYGLCLLTTAIPHVRYMYPLIIFIVWQVVFTGRVQLLCLQDISDLLVRRLWSWDASPAPVGRVDEGLHIFLVWSYLVTTLAVLVWAGSLYRSGVGRYGYGKLAVTAVLVVLVGPVAAAVELLWGREEMVISGRASGLDRSDSTSQSTFRSKSGSGMGKWERGGKVLRFD